MGYTRVKETKMKHTMKMETSKSSETLVSYHNTTRRQTPKGLDLNIQCTLPIPKFYRNPSSSFGRTDGHDQPVTRSY